MLRRVLEYYHNGKKGWVFGGNNYNPQNHRDLKIDHSQMQEPEYVIFEEGSAGAIHSNGNIKVHVSVDPKDMPRAIEIFINLMSSKDAPRMAWKINVEKELQRTQPAKQIAIVFDDDFNPKNQVKIKEFLNILNNEFERAGISPEPRAINSDAEAARNKYDAPIKNSRYFNYRFENDLVVPQELFDDILRSPAAYENGQPIMYERKNPGIAILQLRSNPSSYTVMMTQEYFARLSSSEKHNPKIARVPQRDYLSDEFIIRQAATRIAAVASASYPDTRSQEVTANQFKQKDLEISEFFHILQDSNDADKLRAFRNFISEEFHRDSNSAFRKHQLGIRKELVDQRLLFLEEFISLGDYNVQVAQARKEIIELEPTGVFPQVSAPEITEDTLERQLLEGNFDFRAYLQRDAEGLADAIHRIECKFFDPDSHLRRREIYTCGASSNGDKFLGLYLEGFKKKTEENMRELGLTDQEIDSLVQDERKSIQSKMEGLFRQCCQCQIKALTGNSYTVFIDPNKKVLDLKQRIANKTGIPVERIRLIVSSNVCEDNETVGKYKIEGRYLFHMILRLRACSMEQKLTDHNFPSHHEPKSQRTQSRRLPQVQEIRVL